MSKPPPLVFYRTKILEVSDEALVMEIPGVPLSTWILIISAVLVLAAPPVLFCFQARGLPDAWQIGVVVLGAVFVIVPWSVIERVALSWSRLAPARGRVEIRRTEEDAYSLTLDGRVVALSRRRGLFFLEQEGVNVLVLVIGDRTTTISTYVQTGATGIDWSFSEFDKARAELARGASPLTETWPARSVVPLVRAVSQVLRLGPQSPISAEAGLGLKTPLVTIFWVLALPVLHLAGLTWLKAHPNFGEPLPLLARGLLVGALAILPDVWILSRFLKRVWLDPFNRKAEEMVSRCS